MLTIYSDKIVQNDAVISGYIHIADGKIQKIDEKSSLKEYIDMTGKIYSARSYQYKKRAYI